MSDDKKIGLFKRLFGFGKAAPESVPVPAEVKEIAPLVDEHADRIAAEIEQAKQAAVEAKFQEERFQEEQFQEQKRLETEQKLREHQARELKKVTDEAAREAKQSEAAKIESTRLETARLEKERIAAEALHESERLVSEQLVAAQAQAAKADAEKLAAVNLENERLETKRVEQERLIAENKRQADQQLELARVEASPVVAPVKTSWWQRLKGGLSRTANTVSDGITGLFTKRKLDGDTLEELEDILIQADLGIDVAARIAAAVGKGRYDKEIEPDEVKAILAEEVAKVLAPVAKPLIVDITNRPFVILMVGVNGSGKTTTIGKLTSKFRAEGKSVMLAAGDTFRAAAIEQLRVWGDRTGTTVISRNQGADSSGLAFDALKAAKDSNTDVLLIDTAGRLQNRTELMAELEKMVRVIKKMDDTAPHAVLLVLDATVGQNALSQVEIFGKVAGVTGLVMTKLDGTARGGILVAIAEKFKLPVHFIGVGEGIDDLEPFSAQDFARAISGLEQLNS
jgi:fused signal recognition particle receptor